ncbi:hypothetical protein INR49_002600 [Caranx melampygus]|nr:hypothetical protein INR49_002600 [Caranx melampygus]
MGQDESVLILMKHCRDMKRQESCLRLTTLLLVLSCAAVFIFVIGASRQRGDSETTGQTSTAVQQPAYSKQEGNLCPASADTADRTPSRPHIHLNSMPAENKTDGQYIKWHVFFGGTYNEERRAIVIPKKGVYFVYVTITLNCHETTSKTADFTDFNKFFVQLRNWNDGYDTVRPIANAWSGVTCSSHAPMTVFVGKLFELMQGDHVSVWIELGYRLIMDAAFGAHLA